MVLEEYFLFRCGELRVTIAAWRPVALSTLYNTLTVTVYQRHAGESEGAADSAVRRFGGFRGPKAPWPKAQELEPCGFSV